VGLESTIIDCTSKIPRILRPGAITISMIEEATGLRISNLAEQLLVNKEQIDIRVSGSLENHYAPKAKVILDEKPTAGAGFIALAEIETPPDVIRLAAPKSVEEFARFLYSALREGDHQMLDSIFIAQPPGEGIAIAIRDRLARSAKGR
jgi:L-threonylcarbamoyladenylate synthase